MDGETSYSLTDEIAQYRRRLRWEIAATLALIFGSAGLGYLVVPAYERNRTSISLQFALAGVAVLVAFVIAGVIICCAEPRPPRAYGPERGKPGQLLLHDGETSYSLTDEIARSRRRLRWEIAATLALIFGGAGLGYLVVPAYVRNATPPPPPPLNLSLEFMGVVVLGLAALTGVFLCCVEAWPRPAYGPKPAPKPLPLWLALLRLIGCWLLTLPFSLICLLLVAGGVDDAVNGSWGQAAIVLAIGIASGIGGFVLIAGSGVAAGTGLRPGGKVPDVVRRSRWWRHVLWMLALWAMLMTGIAVNYGVQGHWGDFCGALVTALGSWLALMLAADGEVPEDAFSCG